MQLAIAICAKNKYKRDCTIIADSIYLLLPLVFSLIFITFRIYISLPVIILAFLVILYAEKSEIGAIEKKYNKKSQKRTNKIIIIFSSLVIIIILLSILCILGVYYIF